MKRATHIATVALAALSLLTSGASVCLCASETGCHAGLALRTRMTAPMECCPQHGDASRISSPECCGSSAVAMPAVTVESTRPELAAIATTPPPILRPGAPLTSLTVPKAWSPPIVPSDVLRI